MYTYTIGVKAKGKRNKIAKYKRWKGFSRQRSSMPPSSHKQMKTLASYCNTLKGKQKITEKKAFWSNFNDVDDKNRRVKKLLKMKLNTRKCVNSLYLCKLKRWHSYTN